jgi:ABC-type polysaccharide/polyol phosphate export permease
MIGRGIGAHPGPGAEPAVETLKKYAHELLRRRDLIVYLVTSGLKAQHRNTILGYFWWLLDPLLGLLIYYFVVAVIFRGGGEGYGLYLILGLVAWRWLSATIAGASRAIVGQAGIIGQVYLPKVVFPITATLTGLVNFAFGLVVLALFFVAFGAVPGVAILWLPFVVLTQALFTMALASVLAYVCVFLRDTNTLVNHLMTLWFFATPVIWREDLIPEGLRWLVAVNPMAHLLAGYRDALIGNRTPELAPLIATCAVSTGVIGFMIYYYSQHEHRIIRAL